MSDSSTNHNDKGTWLQTTLSELFSAPHISFHGPPGFRQGPGPIDLFSTKFNNLFAPDVKAVVNGEQVNREGLKKMLLDLQRQYNPDNVKFRVKEEGVGTTASEDGPSVSFTGTSKDVGEYEVSATARMDGAGGGRKITSFTLEGNPDLFTRPTG